MANITSGTGDADALKLASRDSWPIAAKWTEEEVVAHRPTTLIRPRTSQEIIDAFATARQQGRAIVALGGGSGVCGAAIPPADAIMLDMKAMNAVLDFDPVGMTIRVEAGILGGVLEEWLSERGFTCGHYPQSLHISTVGGWIATRGTGTFSNKYGGIERMVQAITVVLPNGQTLSFGRAPRSAAGPNLIELFLGAEGTFGVITEATLRVFPKPQGQLFTSYRLKDLAEGIEAVRHFYLESCVPALVRLYDPKESEHLYEAAGVPTGGALLILCHEGNSKLAEAEAAICQEILQNIGIEILGSSIGQNWNKGRYRAAWLDANLDSDKIADSIEVSVGWRQLMPIYDDVMARIKPLCSASMGHLSHFYTSGGMIYFIFLIQDTDQASLRRRYAEVWSIVTEAALRHGGTTTHHHGVGLARRATFYKEVGAPAAALLQTIKSALDPENILNPGKLALR